MYSRHSPVKDYTLQLIRTINCINYVLNALSGIGTENYEGEPRDMKFNAEIWRIYNLTQEF